LRTSVDCRTTNRRTTVTKTGTATVCGIIERKTTTPRTRNRNHTPMRGRKYRKSRGDRAVKKTTTRRTTTTTRMT